MMQGVVNLRREATFSVGEAGRYADCEARGML